MFFELHGPVLLIELELGAVNLDVLDAAAHADEDLVQSLLDLVVFEGSEVDAEGLFVVLDVEAIVLAGEDGAAHLDADGRLDLIHHFGFDVLVDAVGYGVLSIFYLLVQVAIL
jgi:hypothetical protein